MSSFTTEVSDPFLVKAGLARMLKGGVIMDVINVEQAKVALLSLDSLSFDYIVLNALH